MSRQLAPLDVAQNELSDALSLLHHAWAAAGVEQGRADFALASNVNSPETVADAALRDKPATRTHPNLVAIRDDCGDARLHLDEPSSRDGDTLAREDVNFRWRSDC